MPECPPRLSAASSGGKENERAGNRIGLPSGLAEREERASALDRVDEGERE